MSLNIKNERVDNLLGEVVEITGESKTEAVRRALEERRDRLALRRAAGSDLDRIWQLLERDVWPLVPKSVLGSPPWKKEEEEAFLGFGPEGV